MRATNRSFSSTVERFVHIEEVKGSNPLTTTMKKNDWIILGVILLIGLIFRLYQIDSPLADLHSWRQADTAAVARNFVYDGFNLFVPRYDDLSNVQSGHENPQGYRFVEFPLYNALFALLYTILPFWPVEIWGRLVNIFFSLGIIAIIYYLGTKEENRTVGIAAASFYAIFPFFVFMSRMVLPETTALGFTFLSLFLLYLWKEKNTAPRTNMLLFGGSLVSFACALLIKPTTIFYGLSLAFLFLRKYPFAQLIKRWEPYVFFLLAAVPLILWRLYIKQYPEGIPGSQWLFWATNTPQGLQSVFMKPPFFRWIFFERINNIIFGGFATAFFLIGIVYKPKKYFFLSLLASAVCYLLVFQGGNVQHEYYQTLILPPLALFAGKGISALLSEKKIFPPWISLPVVAGMLVFSFFFSYFVVRDYYGYPKGLIRIASVITENTSRSDRVVTDSMGDTTLLYLSDRRGSPVKYKDLPELTALGYTHFITYNGETIQKTKEKGYTPIYEDDEMAIFPLIP